MRDKAKNYPQAITALLEITGWSVAELARKVGASERTVWNWKKGDSWPRLLKATKGGGTYPEASKKLLDGLLVAFEITG